MRVKLSQSIDYFGEITTLAKLLDDGKAYVEKIQYHRRGKPVTGYRCTIPYDGSEYEFVISQKAYESRAAKGQDKLTVLSDSKPPLDPIETRYIGEVEVDGDYWHETIVYTLDKNRVCEPFDDSVTIYDYDAHFENNWMRGYVVYHS